MNYSQPVVAKPIALFLYFTQNCNLWILIDCGPDEPLVIKVLIILHCNLYFQYNSYWAMFILPTNWLFMSLINISLWLDTFHTPWKAHALHSERWLTCWPVKDIRLCVLLSLRMYTYYQGVPNISALIAFKSFVPDVDTVNESKRVSVLNTGWCVSLQSDY